LKNKVKKYTTQEQKSIYREIKYYFECFKIKYPNVNLENLIINKIEEEVNKEIEIENEDEEEDLIVKLNQSEQHMEEIIEKIEKNDMIGNLMKDDEKIDRENKFNLIEIFLESIENKKNNYIIGDNNNNNDDDEIERELDELRMNYQETAYSEESEIKEVKRKVLIAREKKKKEIYNKRREGMNEYQIRELDYYEKRNPGFVNLVTELNSYIEKAKYYLKYITDIDIGFTEE